MQEAVRIIPMRLRIVGYTPSEVASFPDRPTIHVEGETAGPAGSSTTRKVHGSVMMIADGSVRWMLVSTRAISERLVSPKGLTSPIVFPVFWKRRVAGWMGDGRNTNWGRDICYGRPGHVDWCTARKNGSTGYVKLYFSCTIRAFPRLPDCWIRAILGLESWLKGSQRCQDPRYNYRSTGGT